MRAKGIMKATLAGLALSLLMAPAARADSAANQHVSVSCAAPGASVTVDGNRFDIFAPGYPESFAVDVMVVAVNGWTLVKPKASALPLKMKGGDTAGYEVERDPEDEASGTIAFHNYHIKSDHDGGAKDIVVPAGASVTYTAYRNGAARKSDWTISGPGITEFRTNIASIVFNRSPQNVGGWFALSIEASLTGEYTIQAHDTTQPLLEDAGEMTMVEIDLDIDSDHTNGDFGGPDRDGFEESIEEVSPGPFPHQAHKYVLVNTCHAKGDYLPGYANFAGVSESAPNTISFTPITLELLPYDALQEHLEGATITLAYSCSDPSLTNSNKLERGVWEWQRPEGMLRIWTKDISATRDPASIMAGGDFIPADVAIPLTKLDVAVPLTLYVEAIRPAASLGTTSIEVEVNLPGIAGGIVLRDKIHCTPIEVNVAVDNFNDSGYERSVHESEAEDHYEEYIDGTNHVGRIVMVSDGDDDSDGIPGFADGYGLFDLPEYQASANSQFVPVIFELLKPIDPERASVKLTYDASDPLGVTTNSAGEHLLPESGKLRLWTKDGDEPRDGRPVTAGGNFLAAGEYSAIQFGFSNENSRTLTYYIEAVKPSEEVGDLRILFEARPDDRTGFMAADAVRVTATDISIELLARDPESGDIYECTDMVLASHPVPQIDLQVLDAQLDGGAIAVSVSGTLVDRMSELSQTRVGSISVMYGGEEIDMIPVIYGGPGEMPWQPATSGSRFSRTYTLPYATLGTHIIRFIAGPNAAGEVGQAAVAVCVEERFMDPQPVPPSAPISIVFPLPPTTNALDTAVVYFGDRGSTTNDLSVAEAAGNPLDEYFAGHIRYGTNEVPFELFMCGSLSFDENTNDAFTAVARYVTDVTNVIDIAATWRETATNSLRFFPSAFFLLEPATEPVIADTAILQGTPPGFIEPFIARVRSSLPQEETEALFAAGGPLSMTVANEPLCITSDGPDGDLYLSDSPGGAPRLFVALADDVGMVPPAAYAAHYLEFSLSDRSDAVLRANGAHLTEPEVDDAVQPALFAVMAVEEGTPADHRAWTVEQAWMWYRILYPKTGHLLQGGYTAFGGTVVKAEVPGIDWKNYKVGNHTGEYNRSPVKPVITLDDDISNAVEAGVALGMAMWCFDGSHRPQVRKDYNDYVDIIFIDLMQEGDEVAQEEIMSFQRRRLNRAVGELERLGNAVELGINVIPLVGGTLGFLVDTTKIEADISAGKYGKAGCTAVFAVLGVLGDALKAGEVIRIKGLGFLDDLPPAGRQAMETALTATTRKGKIAALRGAMANGDISVDLVGDLYKSGFLKIDTKSAHYRLLQQAVEAGGASYNRLLHIRHHDLPLQFELRFLKAGIDPDEWGRFLLKDLKTHKAFHTGKGWGRGGPWNYQWRQFFEGKSEIWRFDKDNPFESVMAFMEELRRRTPEGAVTIDWPFKLITVP